MLYFDKTKKVPSDARYIFKGEFKVHQACFCRGLLEQGDY